MLHNIFISDAMAQAAGDPQASFSSFIPLLLVFGIFYFLIIRPQSKKYKEHQAMVEEIKSGQKVVTNAGILGVIKGVDKNEGIFDLEIADNVIIKIRKSHVAELINDKSKSKEKPATKKKNNKK